MTTSTDGNEVLFAEAGPLAALRSLGDDPELVGLVGPGPAQGPGPSGRGPLGRPPKVNSHVHLPPNFSAFATVAEATDLAAAQGVRVLGGSNYYDFEVYGPFAQLSWSKGIFPLFGLEVVCLVEDLQKAGVRINDPGNPGKMYLCGKGITRFAPMNAAATALMGEVRRTDSDRILALIAKLHSVFGVEGARTTVTEGSIKASVVARSGAEMGTVFLQERHVAQAFQEDLSALPATAPFPAALLGLPPGAGPGMSPVSVQNAIRSQVMKAGKPGYVEEAFVDFDHSYRMVLELGGVPCYPVLADGARPVCEFETPVDDLVTELRRREVHCAEMIPNRNAPEVVEAYALTLRSAGIPVLAGTEHNTLEMVPVEPTCAGGVPIPERVKDVFWEGACVIAAHQWLTANGREGYVDSAGQPNASYPSAGARIEAFARLGAAVIDRYAELTAPNSVKTE